MTRPAQRQSRCYLIVGKQCRVKLENCLNIKAGRTLADYVLNPTARYKHET